MVACGEQSPWLDARLACSGQSGSTAPRTRSHGSWERHPAVGHEAGGQLTEAVRWRLSLCPIYKQVVVTEGKNFAFGKAEILPKSFGLTDEVVRAIGDHSRLCVRIERHTDSVGGAKKNLKLSDDRASSVRATW